MAKPKERTKEDRIEELQIRVSELEALCRDALSTIRASFFLTREPGPRERGSALIERLKAVGNDTKTKQEEVE